MTSLRANDLVIANEALALIGHDPIPNFEGKTPASEKTARLYPLVLGRLLDGYAWRFALRALELTRLSALAAPGYLYVHALPNDAAGYPARVYQSADGLASSRWAVYEDGLHSCHERVWIDYVRAGAVSGTFRNLFVRALAADLSLSISDDRTIRDRLYSEAFGPPSQNGKGGLFQMAMSEDSHSAPTRNVLDAAPGPLVEASLGYYHEYDRRDRDWVGRW